MMSMKFDETDGDTKMRFRKLEKFALEITKIFGTIHSRLFILLSGFKWARKSANGPK